MIAPNFSGRRPRSRVRATTPPAEAAMATMSNTRAHQILPCHHALDPLPGIWAHCAGPTFLLNIDWVLRKVNTAEPKTIGDQFALFVSTVVDYAIFMLDPTGKIVTWNDGAQRIKGYAAATDSNSRSAEGLTKFTSSVSVNASEPLRLISKC